MRQARTNRVMVFHRPFIQHLASDFPEGDLLLGKPMPVQAVRRFYAEFRGDSGFVPARQLQWMVDTPARLDQYRALARSLGIKMRVNLEIDVGLHRGGVDAPDVFGRMVRTFFADSDHLEFAGLM